MFGVIFSLIGLLVWVLITAVLNVLFYGMITLGLNWEWLVAIALGGNIVLGFLGQMFTWSVIDAYKEYKKGDK